MQKHQMKINVKKIAQSPDIFEFTISSPFLRTQFRLPRNQVNELRILLEKVLIEK